MEKKQRKNKGEADKGKLTGKVQGSSLKSNWEIRIILKQLVNSQLRKFTHCIVMST